MDQDNLQGEGEAKEKREGLKAAVSSMLDGVLVFLQSEDIGEEDAKELVRECINEL